MSSGHVDTPANQSYVSLIKRLPRCFFGSKKESKKGRTGSRTTADLLWQQVADANVGSLVSMTLPSRHSQSLKLTKQGTAGSAETTAQKALVQVRSMPACTRACCPGLSGLLSPRTTPQSVTGVTLGVVCNLAGSTSVALASDARCDPPG